VLHMAGHQQQPVGFRDQDEGIHSVCLQGGLREVLARQRVALEGARLLVLNASHALDRCECCAA
jgi:hypothetical protein